MIFVLIFFQKVYLAKKYLVKLPVDNRHRFSLPWYQPWTGSRLRRSRRLPRRFSSSSIFEIASRLSEREIFTKNLEWNTKSREISKIKASFVACYSPSRIGEVPEGSSDEKMVRSLQIVVIRELRNGETRRIRRADRTIKTPNERARFFSLFSLFTIFATFPTPFQLEFTISGKHYLQNTFG